MGLRALLTRTAAARPHVLLVATPGGTAVRLAAEKELRLRDWPVAATPAEADLLFVAGPHCPALTAALDRLWQDMPRPRARLHAAGAHQVPRALDAARDRLAAPDEQHTDGHDAGPPSAHPGDRSRDEGLRHGRGPGEHHGDADH